MRQLSQCATVTLTLACLIALPALSQPDESPPFSNAGVGAQVDRFTGAATATVKIHLPPGRKHTTPKLALQYNSGGAESSFGRGWSLPLGKISRSTKRGVPRCDGPWEPEFVLSLSGSKTELSPEQPEAPGEVAKQVYHARYDTSYFEATHDDSSNVWTVIDRTGITFRFGEAAAARVFKDLDVLHDPANCAFTSIWHLTSITDPFGNSVDISYIKDQNVAYLDLIEYGGNPSQSLAHPFRVEFDHTSDPTAARQYAHRTFASGVDQVLANRITSIRIKTAEPGQQHGLLREYGLVFSDELVGGASLLKSVTATDLPTAYFDYSGSSFEFGEAIPFTPPVGFPGDHLEETVSHNFNGADFLQSTRRSLYDVTGDGIPDWLDLDASANQLRVAPGQYASAAAEAGFSNDVLQWYYPAPALMRQESHAYSEGVQSQTVGALVDRDRDGDLEYWHYDGGPPSYLWRDAEQSCSGSLAACGFSATWYGYGSLESLEPILRIGSIANPCSWYGYPQSDDYRCTQSQRIDLNGDGYLDAVSKSSKTLTVTWWDPAFFLDATQSPSFSSTAVGGNWDFQRRHDPDGNSSWLNTLAVLSDVNGDGLPDLVLDQELLQKAAIGYADGSWDLLDFDDVYCDGPRALDQG